MGMFGGKGDAAATEPTGLSIISIVMTVRGDLESTGTVKVEGAVEGNVRARQQVLVAKGGVVHGDVEAREAVIGGTVHGAIRCQERVEIQSDASVHGDLTTRRILVAEGASDNGLIRMGDAPLLAHAEAPASRVGSDPRSPTPEQPSAPIVHLAVPPHSGSSNH